MSDMPHYCSACGQTHGGQAVTDPSIEIARINADRDIAVARLQARQARDGNETAVAVAEVEGDAQVGAAEAVAEVIAAETAPEPVIIEAPEPEPEPDLDELEESEPPENDGPAATPPPATKKRKGWWG